MTPQARGPATKRDFWVILAAITAVTAIAWTYVLWFAPRTSMAVVPAADMSGMDMPDMRMDGDTAAVLLSPALVPWTTGRLAATLAMWVAMMIGMMLPSAAPMILLYARVGRQALLQGRPFAATGWFSAGYLLAWAAFSVMATGLQWGLEHASLLTPMMAGTNPVLGGFTLLAAGIYEWCAAKDACLVQCQSPLSFLQQQGGFRGDVRGALRLGVRHGAYCVGCCWALMLLLFVGGVMNVLWIAGLGALVLLEKIAPKRWPIARMAGVMLAGVGVGLLAGTWHLAG